VNQTDFFKGSTYLTRGDHPIVCPAEMVGDSKEIIQTGTSECLLVLSTMSSSEKGGLHFRFMAVEIKKS
jgi:hypothetical protein